MHGRNKAATVLVVLGVLVLVVAAALHALAAYPRVASALSTSNLPAQLQGPLRAVFLLVGWDWVVFATLALLGTFVQTKLRKTLILLCALALLVSAALTFAFMGVFLGNEMLGSAGLFLLIGGLLFHNSA